MTPRTPPPSPVQPAPPAPRSRHLRAPGVRSTLVLSGLVLAAVLSTRWVRLNVSGSLPYGLYRLAPVPQPLPRGTVVLLPVPATVQHVWSRWIPLLKPVAAVVGDTVCATEERLWINDENYGPVLRTAYGRHLPHMPEGCFVVQEGEVFLASPVMHSLDSRYFSFVRISALTAQALPVFTWQ
jgi:conjugative transfer signal peptidase TraF